MKKAYGYTREIQNSKTQIPISAQKGLIKKYCVENNIELVRMFSDKADPNTNYNPRGLKRLRGLLRKNHVDYVIVSDLQSVFISQFDYYGTKRDFEYLGSEILSVSKPVWDSKAYEEFMADIIKRMNEFNSKLLGKKL